MKHTKKLAQRIAAGAMSAALLFSGTNLGSANKTVRAADNDYYQALSLSLYFFDANACGSDVDDGPLTWRGNCHTYDGKAAISDADNFDSSCRSLVDPDGDGFVDVSGGYHDAGDHIKFNLTMGFAFASLAMSEYMNPGVYDKAGCKDHLVALLKRNADYMMKTTFLNSSGEVATICHVVADGNADHSVWSSPEGQTYPRKTYWLTAGNNNTAVCGDMAAALAGCAYVVKQSDPAYAAECLKYAQAIYNFGKAHDGNYTGGLGGFYDTEATHGDELAWAQAMLWVAGAGSEPTIYPSGGAYNGEYDGWVHSWNKVWQGYAAMMYKATGNGTFKSQLEAELQKQGGLSVGKYNADGWGASRLNCAKQMTAYAIANGNKSDSHVEGAKWQMDYILGNNTLGYSFLDGYGSKWPTHIHHRAANPGSGDPAQNPESKYTLYGALIGGPDSTGSYQDNTNEYQFTEPALDYNGCFALACAALADMFGGSDKGAASIVSRASEFKSGYSFGNGNTTITPDPTQPDPTQPDPTQPNPTQPNTDPTQPTTQEPTQSQPSDQKATYTEKTNEEGNTYWTIDISGASKVKVVAKTNSSDTETNGCFNPPGGWAPDDWAATPNGDGTFTVEYTNKNNYASVDFYVWWPKTATIVEVIKTVAGTSQDPTQPQPTDPQPTQPQPTDPQPTQPQPTDPQPTQPQPTDPTTPTSGNVTKYGDTNCDGEVDILDVIMLNKSLLGSATLSPNGAANADVDANGKVDSTDSLNILKCVVKIIQQSELPVR